MNTQKKENKFTKTFKLQYYTILPTYNYTLTAWVQHGVVECETEICTITPTQSLGSYEIKAKSDKSMRALCAL